MSQVFVSHRSTDSPRAAEVKERLQSLGYGSVFLDFDPSDGIPAGEDWEQTLYRRLESCDAVVVLLSEDWVASNWCFAEAALARMRGKAVIPIRLDDARAPQFLERLQAVDLRQGGGAWERLARDLGKLDLKRRPAPESGRAPYPGLSRFDEADAAYYYGRDDEVVRLVENLNSARRSTGPIRITVIGASGSGKSSLVRAGLVPRLREQPEQWILVGPFRPGLRPLEEVAIQLSRAVGAGDDPGSWRPFLGELQEIAQSGQDREQRVVDFGRSLREQAGTTSATVLVLVDQAEELLRDSSSAEGTEEFLELLAAALEAGHALWGSLCTLRSDSFAEFAAHPETSNLCRDGLFTIDQLSPEGLEQIIVEPARVAALGIEPKLVERLKEDAASLASLPLLAFTLRELYELGKEDHELTLSEYEGLGGMKGAISRAAEELLTGENLSGPQMNALGSVFVDMARMSESGVFTRRPIYQDKIPKDLRPLIARFIDRGLLVSRKERAEVGAEEGAKGRPILEIGHEALFRSWDRLESWLENNRRFLEWRRRLGRAVKSWKETRTLLYGSALKVAKRYLRAGKKLDDDERGLIRESLAKRRRSLALRAATGILVISVALLGLAVTRTYVRLQHEDPAVVAEEVASEDLRRHTRTRFGLARDQQLIDAVDKRFPALLSAGNAIDLGQRRERALFAIVDAWHLARGSSGELASTPGYRFSEVALALSILDQLSEQLENPEIRGRAATLRWKIMSLLPRRPVQNPLAEGFVLISTEGGADFYLQATEVTAGEYLAFDPDHPKKQELALHADLPASDITWFEAYSYAASRGGRLPTAAEWDRAQSREADPDDWERIAWFNLEKWRVHPPAEKEPNAQGIYDLFGNVAEWTADLVPGSTEVEDWRVFCGGHALATELVFPCDRNRKRLPHQPSRRIGFRVRLAAVPTEPSRAEP